MVTHHIDEEGNEFSLYESPMEIPWFRKVAEESEKKMDEIYQFDPNLCSAWYRELREKRDAGTTT